MPPTISDLIRASGLPYSLIADRSGLSKARVGQLAAGSHVFQMPPRKTVEGLALALDVPVGDVADAIEESVRGSGGTARDLARRIADLPDRDRRLVARLVEALETL